MCIRVEQHQQQRTVMDSRPSVTADDDLKQQH